MRDSKKFTIMIVCGCLEQNTYNYILFIADKNIYFVLFQTLAFFLFKFKIA